MEDVVIIVVFFGATVAFVIYFVLDCLNFKKMIKEEDMALRRFEAAIKPGVRLVEKDLEMPIDPFMKWTPTYLKVEEVRTNTMGEKWVLVFDGLTSKTMQMTVLYERYELL